MSTPPTIASVRLNPAQVAALEHMEKYASCYVGQKTVLANNQIAGKTVNLLEDHGFCCRRPVYSMITSKGCAWLALYRAYKEGKK